MFSHGATARMGGQKTINLCGIGCHSGIVAVIMAFFVVVFFAEVVSFLVFLRVEKTINLCSSLGGCCGWWHFGF